MALDLEKLRRQARRRYEWGRLLRGLRFSCLVLPMLAVSLIGCGQPAVTGVCGIALFGLIVAFAWRGQAWQRAIVPGLLGGSAPLVFPLLARTWGLPCLAGGWCPMLPAVCLAGGLVGATIVGLHLARAAAGGPKLLLPSLLVAGLAGSLGCALGGLTGVLGMLAGMTVGAAPAYWATRRSPG